MLNLENIKCVLFDLDDTLLRNSWKLVPSFLAQSYFALRKDCGSYRTLKALRALRRQELKIDDKSINHDRFINIFAQVAQLPKDRCRVIFDQVLPDILVGCKHHFEPIEEARLFLESLKGQMPLVLATNPILPETVTKQRIEWAGLNSSDFSLVTHSQNMHHCKPSIHYYEEILSILAREGVSHNQCLFIGNDPKNDAAAVNCGITTVLIDEKMNGTLKLLHGKDLRRAALFQGSWDSIAKELKMPFEGR